MIVAAILVAAGSGSRLGAEVPKAFVALHGVPMLAHPARQLCAHRFIRDVVVVAPDGWTEAARAAGPGLVVVTGGEYRQLSVQRGLAALRPDVDVVLVHDAARPFVPTEVIDRVLRELADGAPAVIPVMPLADTVKRVDARGRVVETLTRADLRAVQTPQGFQRAVLVEAHRSAPADALDDASLVERLGVPVVVVDGHEDLYKITTTYDLDRAEAETRIALC